MQSVFMISICMQKKAVWYAPWSSVVCIADVLCTLEQFCTPPPHCEYDFTTEIKGTATAIHVVVSEG